MVFVTVIAYVDEWSVNYANLSLIYYLFVRKTLLKS